MHVMSKRARKYKRSPSSSHEIWTAREARHVRPENVSIRERVSGGRTCEGKGVGEGWEVTCRGLGGASRKRPLGTSFLKA